MDAKPGCRSEAVPAPAVRRLSLYLRELEAMLRRDRQTTSSMELGEKLGYTDAQVRKDLAYFGQFGHPGVGYRVDELISRIRAILGTDKTWNAVVVGAGQLGGALAAYRGFGKRGFRIVAVFDNDPEKVGRPIENVPELRIRPLDQLRQTVVEQDVQMGICAVPAEAAQQVADDLVAAGVKGILNFAPVALVVPDGFPVASVELAVHLEQLAYRINTEIVSRSAE